MTRRGRRDPYRLLAATMMLLSVACSGASQQNACAAGHSGETCAQCTCVHGTCVSGSAGYSCSCTGGYMGTLCDSCPSGTQDTGAGCAPLAFCGISFSKQTDIASAARPEIVATANNVFAVYLHVASVSRTFAVNAYAADMSSLASSRTLVADDGTHGQPTDIRVASDGEFAYAFYQTVNNQTNSAYLWGAKYGLDAAFTEKATTGVIASGPPPGTSGEVDGTEKTDDPIVLLAYGKVFAITRYKATFDASSAMRYKVHEFSTDLVPGPSFDLDLSSVAAGGARQASAIAVGDSVYMAVPSTNGTASVADLATISDIVIVQLDSNWSIVSSKNVSTDHTDVETYSIGLAHANGTFFLTYNRRSGTGLTSFSSPLVVLDDSLAFLDTVVVRTKQPAELGLRPSLYLDTGRILVTNDSNTGPANLPSAEIRIYAIDWRTGACP